MKTITNSACLILCGLFLLIASNARAEDIADYYPLTQADSWVYQTSSASTGIEKDTINGTELIGGVLTTIMESDDGSKEYSAIDTQGLKLYRHYFPQDIGDPGDPDDDTPEMTITYSPAILLVNKDFNNGDVCSGTSTAYITIGADTISVPLTYSNSVSGPLTITVPVGTFNVFSCLSNMTLDFSAYGQPIKNVSTTVYVAKNIGIIKNVYVEGSEEEGSELLRYNIHNIPASTSDLEGLWRFYNVTAGEGWSYGYIQFDNSGTVTDAHVYHCNGSDSPGDDGELHVFADGACLGWVEDSKLQGALSTTRDLFTYNATLGEMEAPAVGTAIKPNGTYNNSNLEGAWNLVGLISYSDAHCWIRGSITFNNSGTVTGGYVNWRDNYDTGTVNFTGGTCTVNANGTFTAHIHTDDPDSYIDVVEGAINNSRDTAACTLSGIETGENPSYGIATLRKNINTPQMIDPFEAADFKGLWRTNSLLVDCDPDPAGWRRGVIISDGNGNIVDGVFSNMDGNSSEISSGTYTINPEGFVTSELTFSNPGTLHFHGGMNESRNRFCTTIDEETTALFGTKSSADSEYGIYGIISYAGQEEGDVYVAVFDGPDPKTANLVVTTGMFECGVYGITGLVPGTYYAFAFMDANDSGWGSDPEEYIDPMGGHGSAITLNNANKLARVDVTLEDDSLTYICINEVMAHPAAGNSEWVELYNKSDESIDLGGCFIKDGAVPAHIRPVGRIPAGTTIAPYGYYVIEVSSGDTILNNTGDTVYLMAPDGTTVLDTYSYSSASNIDASFYRNPDGANWATDTDNTPRKNLSNDGPTVIPPGKCMISGYIYDEDTGLPLGGINVWVNPYNGDGGRGTSTQTNGYYFINDIDPDDYRGGAGGHNNYYMKWYNNQIDYNAADHIILAGGDYKKAVNFILGKGGTISGYVYEVDGLTPIQTVNVSASIPDAQMGWGTRSAKSYPGDPGEPGSYTIVVPFGDYIVHAGWESEYLQEYYNGKIDYDDADIVSVTPGNPNRTGINFTLEQGTATLAGTVFDHNGTGIGNIEVEYDSGKHSYEKMVLSEVGTGNYNFSHLPNDIAEIWVQPDPITSIYAASYKDLYLEEGENLTGFDFNLRRGALIQGELTVFGDGSHPSRIDVDITGKRYCDWFETDTDSDGNYALRLPPGDYAMGVDFDRGYISWPTHITVTEPSETHTVNLTVYRVPDDCVTITGNLAIGATPPEDSKIMIMSLEDGVANSLQPGDAPPGSISIYDYEEGDAQYTLHVIPNHTYDLVFGFYSRSDEGFRSYTVIGVAENVVVGNTDVTGPAFSFDSVGGEVTGTVTAGDQPVLMAAVYIYNSTGYFAGYTQTDQNGVYHIYNVPAGDYTAYADHRDYSLSAGVPADSVTDGGVVQANIPLPVNAKPTAYIDSISPNPVGYKKTVTLKGHGEDADGTIATYSWRSDIDGYLGNTSTLSLSTLSIGTHTIYFKVRDNQDKWSDEVTFTLNIRGVWITSPQNGGTASGTATIQAASSNAADTYYVYLLVDGTYYAYDNSSPYGFNWNTNYYLNGSEHRLKLIAYFKSPFEMVESDEIKVFTQNDNPIIPALEVTDPTTPGETTVGGTITVNVDGNDLNNFTYVYLYCDDNTYVNWDYQAPFQFNWNTIHFTNGTHTLKAKGYHKYLRNWVESAPIQVQVQNTTPDPPYITITNPADGQTVTGTIPVRATVSHPDRMRYVAFYIDGRYFAYDWQTPFEASLPTQYFTNGQHIIKAISYFYGSYIMCEDTVTVNVNNPGGPVIPRVSIDNLTEGQNISGTVTIQASTNDNAYIKYLVCYINDKWLNYDFSHPYQFSWPTQYFSDGPNIVKIKGYHQITQKWYEDTVTVNVANGTTPIVPIVTINTPSGGSNISGNITISAIVNDPAQMRYGYFYIDGQYMGCDATSPFQTTWQTRYWSNGSHTIKVMAYHDVYHEYYSAETSVNISNVNPIVPVVNISSHTDGQTVSGSQTLTMSSNDTGNLMFMYLYIDEAYAGFDYSAPYAVNCNTTRYSNGMHRFRVMSYHNVLKRYIESPEISLNIQN